MRKYILFSSILIVAIFFSGCSDMLNQQKAKDRDLAKVVSDNVSTDPRMRDHFISLTLVEPGKYRLECKGFTDYDSAGDFGYNVMSVLSERNATLVQTGRSNFTITGVQDGADIFEVFFVVGGSTQPTVTMKGIFEGSPWTF